MQSKQVMKTLELKLVFESAVRLLPKLYVQYLPAYKNLFFQI